MKPYATMAQVMVVPDQVNAAAQTGCSDTQRPPSRPQRPHASICQGVYGFLTPFFSRCKLLGFGNLGIALGTLLSGLAGSYPMLVLARGVASIGSSAQHPVGYGILASYFPKNRGAVMALNSSASNVGTLVATPVATAMLLIMSWRQIFYVVTAVSVVMGVVYFFLRD